MKGGILWQLAVTFASVSMVAVGGVVAVVPDIHRQVVDVLGWMDDATFANLFAISQAAPGPNLMIVSIIGWHMAGFAGLLVATVAMAGPACLLAFCAGRVLHFQADRWWVGAAKAGLVPIAVGLMLSSGLVTARAADRDALTVTITLAVALFTFFSDKNPLWSLASGGAVAVLAWRLGLAV